MVMELRVKASIVANHIFPRNTQDIEGRQSDVRVVIEGTSSYISEMVSGSQVTCEAYIG